MRALLGEIGIDVDGDSIWREGNGRDLMIEQGT